MALALTGEQELIVFILATARSQGVEIYLTLETYHMLTKILRNPPVARAIIANTDVLYPSRPFAKWIRDIRTVTTLTKEDAKILAYGSFGTNLSGTILGCDRVITLDRGLANEFELRRGELKPRLDRLAKRLSLPYRNVTLPQVILLHTG